MESKSVQQRIGVPLALLASFIAFFVASGKMIENESAIYKLIAAAVPILGVISYRALNGSNIKRQIGLGLVINGMAFWGIGWFLVLLLSPTVGWWVYVVGWLALSMGFVIYGAEEAHNRNLPHWVLIILLLGLLPVMAELASPYRFAEELHAGGQLLTMFVYSFGWIMIGYILKSFPAKVPQLEGLPANLMPQTNE
ncbi:MAG: hypothetical protein KC419_22255 [Anaerolineales bacterium]|nr:hypothetical protein [Anaerolineales bacterium]MCA9931231.1 hypothetical protein [Anaerolineales bacterium]